jgi:hypothetical protein
MIPSTDQRRSHVALSLLFFASFLCFYPRQFSDAFVPERHFRSMERIGFGRLLQKEEYVGRNMLPLHMARARGPLTKQSMDEAWLPRQLLGTDKDEFDFDLEAQDEAIEDIEVRSLQLMARLIRQRFQKVNEKGADTRPIVSLISPNKAYHLAKGRFLDLTCSEDGELVLEQLFDDEDAAKEDDTVIKGAVIALQSLLIFGTQLGVKGSPEQLQWSVSHLVEYRDVMEAEKDLTQWDASSVRRLKYRVDRSAGVQLLAELQWKRIPQGANELLVAIGVWKTYEDLALLRSGFPFSRFSDEENAAARAVSDDHVTRRLDDRVDREEL